jgi:uncharacterized protein
MNQDEQKLDLAPGIGEEPPRPVATAEASVLAKPTPEPVAPGERVAAVDVLRGVALLGILAMNIVAFAWPYAGYEDPHFSGGDDPINRTAWLFNALIFSEKMMSLFSMLFGAGLVLMADRLRQRGARVRGVYYRRTLWLLVFGLIHGYLIWYGDILLFYAVCGLLLFLFRPLSPRWLIGLGVGALVFGTLIVLGINLFAGFTERVATEVAVDQAAGRTPAEWQIGIAKVWHKGMRPFFRPNDEEIAEETAQFRSGYLEIVIARAPYLFMVQVVAVPLVIVWTIGGRMLLGMGLMKLGVFAAARSWRFYRLLAVCGYGVGVPLTVLGVVELMNHGYDPTRAPWGALLFELGAVPTALGYAGVVMLICKADALPGLTRRLAAAGRMALSNYLMQSVIGTTLFYGYGLGLFGTIPRVGLWGIVVAIWVLQLIISPLWLKYFRYGPAEWLWRSLTYGRPQPMRYRPGEAPLAA